MDLSWSLVVSACISLIFVGFGGISLLHFPTRKNQVKAADRIFSKRAFEETQKVKEELNNYFATILVFLTKANLSFYAAFIVLSLTVEGLNPGMTIFQAMGRIIPFALIPCLVSMVAKIQAKNLQWSYLDKFNED